MKIEFPYLLYIKQSEQTFTYAFTNGQRACAMSLNIGSPVCSRPHKPTLSELRVFCRRITPLYATMTPLSVQSGAGGK